MRVLAHISDLHFGTEESKVAEGLLSDLDVVKPHLVIISGDLTQRARKKQFIEAKNYLQKINFPKLIIPGNHDIPLFDLFRRIFFPLTRFKKYISDELNPFYKDEEMTVLGINTARSLTWKEGRISLEQITEMQNKLCSVSDKCLKVIVTHHPFIPPPENAGIKLVGRAVKAITIIDKCDVDLLLAGHLHNGYTGDIRPYYPRTKSSVIVVQAGTAISRRRRNEPNSYNLIIADPDKITINVRKWNGIQFNSSYTTTYIKKDLEWKRID